MMLSLPVLLGFVWSLLIHFINGQPQISNQETNKVYAYSYHFQHNGTTNSKDILRTVLGADPDFEIDPPSGQSIIKTFSSPNIRGFFTKGVLPAGPLTHNFNNGFGSRHNTNSAIDNIRKVVENNLRPPNIATGLLPPISPDISNAFPGDFNNVNDVGLNFQKQDDFPKIPPPPLPYQNQDNFPKIPQPPQIQPITQNDFPKIPDPVINNNGVTRIENFSRNTPDGGKIEGQIERFSYNPPPVTNSNSNYQENAEGFRRNENFVNDQGTGHRTQSYFRQSFRTVTPNLDSNFVNHNNRIDNNIHRNGNNNNQWWNAINVLGGNQNNNIPDARNLGQDITNNINQIRNNLENEMNQQFGSRLNNFNNNNNNNIQGNSRQINNAYNNRNNNPGINQRNSNNGYNQRLDNFRNPINNLNNQHNNNRGSNIPFNNQRNNGYSNNQAGNVRAINNNLNNQFNNDDTTKKVLNVINDVNAQLNNNNNFKLTWDDDVPNFNADWSRRQSIGNGRPFSNAHSGPLNNQAGPKPNGILKTTVEALMGNRDFPIPPIPDIGNHGGNYRNSGGGGTEKFFGVDKVVEGPNSFSRNQHRGFERNFHVNSNSGYQHNNQWSTNTIRRLDAQSSKADFSKDFIDVFRDD
ncbi:hypothetical protein CDAR_94251 [Caerostris darwini]|uniref:GATA zinc finger domain-containing protein 14-like n=1 Tax=Caerostris darwini TaxID=1538125 RepID=A0AAV4VQL0_9ARAC|nr:uncharacterized protein CDAR_94252 [Caerostris darwini]GIY72091.1 hypothetical protein CDAR_94251 [Caerostris darwini]